MVYHGSYIIERMVKLGGLYCRSVVYQWSYIVYTRCIHYQVCCIVQYECVIPGELCFIHTSFGSGSGNHRQMVN